LGENLLNLRLSSCATDISDGLLADTKNICQASLLKASLFVDKVPISVAADYVLKKNPQIRITDLLSAGDDYELVFTCSKEKKEDLLKLANKLLVKVTQIGYFTTQTDKDENLLSLFDKNNILITPNKLGYRH
jgi:thiamine-monophosphate kinase